MKSMVSTQDLARQTPPNCWIPTDLQHSANRPLNARSGNQIMLCTYNSQAPRVEEGRHVLHCAFNVESAVILHETASTHRRKPHVHMLARSLLTQHGKALAVKKMLMMRLTHC